MYRIILVLSLFFILIIAWIAFQKYFSKPKEKKHFKTESENESDIQNLTLEFINRKYFDDIVDNAQYFNRMNQVDLIARDIGNVNSYKKLYKDGLKQFSDNEKEKLSSITEQINEILKKQNTKSKLLYSIPWKIAKIDFNIENGFPHTHGDIIIISNKFFELPQAVMVETLLHEKIHIYQRQYPLYTFKLISLWDFYVIDRLENYKESRNNPDINNFVYSKKGDDKPFVQIYNSKHPNGINDSAVYYYKIMSVDEKEVEKQVEKRDLNISDVVTQYEHPYEIMATFIPKIIIHNYNDDLDFTKSTYKWLELFG